MQSKLLRKCKNTDITCIEKENDWTTTQLEEKKGIKGESVIGNSDTKYTDRVKMIVSFNCLQSVNCSKIKPFDGQSVIAKFKKEMDKNVQYCQFG